MLSLCLIQHFACAQSDLVNGDASSGRDKNPNCPKDLMDDCKLQCPNNIYAIDFAGCLVCACPSNEKPRHFECPMMKCLSNCDEGGFRIDENGCRTCECVNKPKSKPRVECSRVMCRMFCPNGFSRDENGCEVCKCNSSPQPCPELNCDNECPNGFRKDYSGCQTCSCEDDKNSRGPVIDGCSPMQCDLNCKYGYERDQSGCQLCSCQRCPPSCRMFCMYGFKKNTDGCDVCECDWSPVVERIACSERIPCKGNRVCNTNLQLCEKVSEDKVNWFVYKFSVQTDLFRDYDFAEAFKRGLVNNIASKYDLEVGQITVSSVESDGTTSFQIMPYFSESADDFQRKIDQIDADLNTNEFSQVIPSVASSINKHRHTSRLGQYFQKHPRALFFIGTISFVFVAIVVAGIFMMICRPNHRFNQRSDSKLPIYETSYHQAPTEDDHYHAVHAPDGTAYVVVESDEMNPSNEKRAIV